MTKMFERAVEKVRNLPEERQDEVGEAILLMLDDDDAGVRLSDVQIAEVRRRLAQPDAMATDEEVEAFFQPRIG